MRRPSCSWLWPLLAVWPGFARADGVADLDPVPRSIGRAGATLVSDDGEGALLFSPAALARRFDTRARVGLVVRDRDIDFRREASGIEVGDRSSPSTSPSFSLITHAGPVVLGAAYIEPRVAEVRLPAPSFGQPIGDVAALFPHRYAGTEHRARGRELRIGGAIRVGESLALGAALSAQHLSVRETRALWAGFSGRDGLANPSRDLELTLEASDRFVPGASMGVLVAPTFVPAELSAAIAWRGPASLEGDARVERFQPTSAGVGSGQGQSSLDLPYQLSANLGARVVLSPLAIEAGGVWQRGDHRTRHREWSVDGMTLTDVSGVRAAVDAIPVQWRSKARWALMSALEVEVFESFLWLTGGYRYSSAGVDDAQLAPTTVELSSHTAAVGAEVYVGGITAIIGYSRSMSASRRHDRSEAELVNPFDGGTELTGNGLYDRADDRVGIAIEMAWTEDLGLSSLP